MRKTNISVFNSMIVAVATTIAGTSAFSHAAAIGIDISVPSQIMAAGDTAGISTLTGARIANFNNLNGPTSQGNVQSLATLQDDSATIVAGATATITGGNTNFGGSFSNSGTQTNDKQLYNTVFDQYDGTAGSLTVTNIPYANYAFIAYIYNDSGAAGRGGKFTVGSQTYYIATSTSISNPDASGNGYVRSLDTTSVTDAAAIGNYVQFDGLTSSTLNVSFVATNSGTARLKIAGFEIVAVPEPASLGMLGGVATLLIRRRRRES